MSRKQTGLPFNAELNYVIQLLFLNNWEQCVHLLVNNLYVRFSKASMWCGVFHFIFHVLCHIVWNLVIFSGKNLQWSHFLTFCYCSLLITKVEKDSKTTKTLKFKQNLIIASKNNLQNVFRMFLLFGILKGRR